MLWFKPYINSVKDLVPIHRIKSIKGYSTPITKEEGADALITLPSGERKYKISVRIKDNNYFTGEQNPSYLAIMLNHLAHELSHLVYFHSHGADHMLLEARIMQRFAKVVEKKRIKDVWVRVTL